VPVETEPPAGARPVDRLDRRARRRQETIEEILDIAVQVMTEEVSAVSVSPKSRRLGVQPPSLYKYFPSLMAVYDALFARGQRANLAVMKDAMADAAPGIAALTKGLEAAGRWSIANRALAQLMFDRPVPSFEPTAEAMSPSEEMVALQRNALADAVRAGELGPDADSIEAVYLVSILISGALSQAFANEPDLPWGEGRFTPQFARAMGVLPALYPPRAARRKR
jgi:AcrR family transcriptional regulator